MASPYGIMLKDTRGRNHTQDDLKAVEMLHSNPKDIPKPTSLLGNLSHEELSATPFSATNTTFQPHFHFHFTVLPHCSSLFTGEQRYIS